MGFDFDQPIDRRATSSLKWALGKGWLTPAQAAADPLPMWIADMDFRVAPAIQAALRAEVEHGVFGYGGTTDAYRDAVVTWQAERFGWRPEPGWIVQAPGIVTALSTAIQAFTAPGDHVLVQPPVYFHFQHDVVANGRRVAEAPLTLDGDRYRFDPERFEAAITPTTTLFLLCHPHNPTGNVWTPAELREMAGICARHGVRIVSDEVHQDLVFGGDTPHAPLAAVLDEELARTVITCGSPSKSFNLAGLACAHVIIADDAARATFRAQSERNGIYFVNTLGTAAATAAYRAGGPWLDAMLAYVTENQRRFAAGVATLGTPLRVLPTDALYLAWLDARGLGLPPAELHDRLLRRARLWLEPGDKFGTGGEGYLRVNLACPARHRR
jgi:cystathionine beta-lyase